MLRFGTCMLVAFVLAAACLLADTASSVPNVLVAAGTELPPVAGEHSAVTHLWVLERAQQQFTLLHRLTEDEPGLLYHAFQANGDVIAAAAHGHRLYCVYSGRSVQAIEFHAPPPPQPPVFRPSQLPSMPAESLLLKFAAGPGGPFALLREPVASSSEAGATNIQGNRGDADSRLVLLRHSGLEWEEVALPPEIETSSVLELLALDDPRGSVVLVTADADSAAGMGEGLTVHRLGSTGWTRQEYAGISPRPAAQRLLIVPHSGVQNLLLAQPRPNSADRELQVLWLRDGAAEVLNAEPMVIPSDVQWWAVPSAGGATLITQGDGGTYRMAHVAFPEGTVSSWVSLQITQERSEQFDVITAVVIAAMVIGTLILLMSGRRSTEPLWPQLPAALRPAGVSRIAAATVDFAVGLAVSMIYFDLLDPKEILLRMARRPSDPEEFMPALLAIAVHVAHTTASELFTGSTLGKAIFGCRVVNLSGEPPHIWQILTRNALKVLEMVAPIFLIFAIISPTYQRLGDLLARTVVVVPSPSPREEDGDDDSFDHIDREG